jgi:hypothetical protein
MEKTKTILKSKGRISCTHQQTVKAYLIAEKKYCKAAELYRSLEIVYIQEKEFNEALKNLTLN